MRNFGRFYSNVGKRPIPVPNAVKISLENVRFFDKFQYDRPPKLHDVVVSGPLGRLTFPLHQGLKITYNPGKIPEESNVSLELDQNSFQAFEKHQKKFVLSMWGTSNSVIRNMVQGVFEGHRIPIKLVGVGYKFVLEEGHLVIKVGYSHLIREKIPQGIEVKLSTVTKILCSSADLHLLTQFAAKVRSHRKPEPYNGKGIFVGEEKIALREGKRTGK